jgi:hypothetical protein
VVGDHALKHLGMLPQIPLGAGVRDRGGRLKGELVFVESRRHFGGAWRLGSGAVVGRARIDLFILVGQLVRHVFASVWRPDFSGAPG